LPNGGGDKAEPTPVCGQGEEGEAYSAEPYEKVVGLAARGPGAAVTDFTLLGGVFLKGGELGVGERFADDGNGEQAEGGEIGLRAANGEQKRGGEDDDGDGLELVELEDLQIEIRGTAGAHFFVAVVFLGAMAHDATVEVGSEAEAPGGDQSSKGERMHATRCQHGWFYPSRE